MNDYLLNPKVCPSSLGENDEPIDPNETAHKWNEEETECNECGAEHPDDLKNLLIILTQ